MRKTMLIAAMLLAATAGAQDSGVPLNLLADTVVVPLTVNGVGPYPFVLDLAAPGMVVDTDVAKYLHLPRKQGVRANRKSTSGRPITGHAVEITTVEAGLAVGRNLTATVTDLQTFKRRFGVPVAGIFSGREFGGFIRLDIASAKVDFAKPQTGLASTDPGAVPIEFAAAAPVVNATIDGRHVRPLAIDTMAPATLLAPESMLRELGLVTDDTRRLLLDAPPNAPAHTGQTQARLRNLRIAAGEIREPICAIAVEGEAARIGIGFLRRFVLTLDYENKLMRLDPLQPGEPMRDPPLVGYGIGLWRFNKEYWTLWVAQNSPAARAGLVSGGILTAVDGKDIKGMPFDAVSTLLQPHANAKLSVSVLQGDDTHTVDLIAEELL